MNAHCWSQWELLVRLDSNTLRPTTIDFKYTDSYTDANNENELHLMWYEILHFMTGLYSDLQKNKHFR